MTTKLLSLQEFIEANGLEFMNRPTRSKLYLYVLAHMEKHSRIVWFFGSRRRAAGGGQRNPVEVPVFPAAAFEAVAASMGLIAS